MELRLIWRGEEGDGHDEVARDLKAEDQHPGEVGQVQLQGHGLSRYLEQLLTQLDGTLSRITPR